MTVKLWDSSGLWPVFLCLEKYSKSSYFFAEKSHMTRFDVHIYLSCF